MYHLLIMQFSTVRHKYDYKSSVRKNICDYMFVHNGNIRILPRHILCAQIKSANTLQPRLSFTAIYCAICFYNLTCFIICCIAYIYTHVC